MVTHHAGMFVAQAAPDSEGRVYMLAHEFKALAAAVTGLYKARRRVKRTAMGEIEQMVLLEVA